MLSSAKESNDTVHSLQVVLDIPGMASVIWAGKNHGFIVRQTENDFGDATARRIVERTDPQSEDSAYEE